MPGTKLRIGILTFHFSENFGALLQAYGLRSWLAGLGHTVEFINYHPSHVEAGGSFSRLLDPRALKANAKIAYLKLTSLRERLFGNKGQAEAFADFRRGELGLTGAPLRDLAEVEAHLAAMPVPYDLIVLGSDQVWSASEQHGLDRVYFADFAVPEGTRRISYAPSFGKATVAPEYRDELRRMLAGLDGISCREASGAAIVRELTGREIACVPDPTLLLGDFAALSRQADGPQGHVFCYALRSAGGIREVTDWVGKELGAPILSPYNAHRRWKEIGQTVYPSPAEWVALVDRAAYVVTNSFHGTVFSILLQKPFLVAGLPGKRAALNERALNLLGELGLQDRFIENGDLAMAQRRFAEPIEWEEVNERLRRLQLDGRDYLDRELRKSMAA
ncbi:polysaccharide pyruvyl transferase family protein [Altererythrobacter sp. CC-YST694]|uniref:polysaccharide pyruvyl transferase family protein n=1 Tax=Altererythrobacter sp. CC-YST694 TaxID=2755038 RepID=UPI001D005979|nr:polysaccharide pyruvyl transferase family protein [Altererythrobacter sp. CC-YST694]MCB5425824.1 polysaccharide pyruvyl transferase family protein [Altererythrobacter sp. CC-YST694]